MAKTVVALEASFDSSQAEGSVKSLRAQLKEAQADVAAMADKFGETSKQAIEAAKRAAELKDKIGDAKDLTATFNPDTKFQAFSQALAGVAGGFAAVQGAMGLFGSESKDLEKTLLKVQSAMAISEGLNSITASIDAYKRLGAYLMSFNVVQKIVTAAQWLWNAAMAANPIGAIITAIAALIAGIVALTSYFMSNAKAAKEQAKAVEESTKALEQQSKTIDRNNKQLKSSQDFKLAYAKASGMSAAAIRELELKLIDEKIAYEKSTRATAYNTYEKEKNKLATLEAADADDELIKKQKENVKAAVDQVNKQTTNLQGALDERTAIINKQTIEVKQQQTDANNKAIEQSQQYYEKQKQQAEQNAKELLDANKKLQDQRRSLEEEYFLKGIEDEDERAKKKLEFDYNKAQEEVKNSKASQKEKNATLLDLKLQYEANIKAIDDVRAKKKLENQLAQDKATDELVLRNRIQAIKNSFDKQQFELEVQRQKEIDDQLDLLNKKLIDQKKYNIKKSLIDAYYNQQQKDLLDAHNKDIEEKDKKAKADALEREKAVADSKKELRDAEFGAIEGGIGILKSLGEKSKGIQKTALIAENAVQIAKIIINTQAAIAAARAGMTAIPAILPPGVPNPAFAAAQAIGNTKIVSAKINAAVGIATAIAATAKGLAALGGGGAGGGGSVKDGGTDTTAPITPQVATTTINQGQVNQLASATARAFVLESDVSGNQERIQRLNRAARIS